MNVVFFYGKQPQSTLCRWFTGSTAYHVGFTDGVHLWDMNSIRRRRVWDSYKARQHLLVPCPVPISREYLEHQLETDDDRYGWLDYLSFGVRPLAKWAGFKVRNFRGKVCSAMVGGDLIATAWQPPGWFPDVPSPGDLEEALLGRRNAIHRTR